MAAPVFLNFKFGQKLKHRLERRLSAEIFFSHYFNVLYKLTLSSVIRPDSLDKAILIGIVDMTAIERMSPRAAEFRAKVENNDRFLSTCDGGDPGQPGAPSIWLMGLEPGWTKHDEEADDNSEKSLLETYSVEHQLTMNFNRNAFKLLAALNGEACENYAAFARRERPFERGKKGYLKLNLFPVACNKLGSWGKEHVAETGFENKRDYQDWMRKTRLPILTDWIAKSRPKLLICTGLTHISDFLAVTKNSRIPSPKYFSINGHTKRLHVGISGLAPIAVIPHLSGGPNGLNSNQAIAHAAAHINDVLAVALS
ncbi:MAG: hypothetical protein R3E18_03335 [Sphingomonadaceae bacterium]